MTNSQQLSAKKAPTESGQIRRPIRWASFEYFMCNVRPVTWTMVHTDQPNVNF